MSTTGEAGQFPSAAGLVLGYSHRQSLAGPAMCPTLAFASVSQGSSFLHVKVMLLIHADGGEGAAPSTPPTVLAAASVSSPQLPEVTVT